VKERPKMPTPCFCFNPLQAPKPTMITAITTLSRLRLW